MKQVIDIASAVTLQELIDQLQAFADSMDPEITYLSIGGDGTSAIRISSLETTLSDGSTVVDIDLSQVDELHHREESRSLAQQYTQAKIPLFRIKTVMRHTGLEREEIYERIERGTFTRGVNIGGQNGAGWPRNEVEALRRADRNGYTEEALRDLVRTLHRERHAGAAA